MKCFICREDISDPKGMKYLVYGTVDSHNYKFIWTSNFKPDNLWQLPELEHAVYLRKQMYQVYSTSSPVLYHIIDAKGELIA